MIYRIKSLLLYKIIMVIFLNKRFVIINTFLIFGVGFLVHGLYEWFPCFLTSIFPVNESLYEHIKLIFMSSVIASSILYFVFKSKKIVIHNFATGLLLSTFFNIIIYYLIYLPVYYKYGYNMVFTLIWYFISIIISQYINYLIINRHNWGFNRLSLFIIIGSVFILTYFTYNPLRIDFFRDPENNTYGIKK